MRNKAVLNYLFALSLYGTIGLFLHFIDYSSEFVVLCRGLLGSLFILSVIYFTKEKINIESIKNNMFLLISSGVALGLNWVFLFAGYRYGIAITSLCNYMAPVIVVLITTIFYKEKINYKQIICIIVAFIGMLLLVGIFDNNDTGDIHCVVYGLLAAIGFVVLILCNRKLNNIKPLDKTFIQLLFSAITVLPYVIINSGFPQTFNTRSTILVMILGIVHTGVAYICYFSAINTLPAQSIAVLGYLEPVLNLIIGAIFLKEKISFLGITGAILIILASIGNEVFSDN